MEEKPQPNAGDDWTQAEAPYPACIVLYVDNGSVANDGSKVGCNEEPIEEGALVFITVKLVGSHCAGAVAGATNSHSHQAHGNV